jgi:RNA polymerase sigma-70 factor (ECF subfamily)
MPMPATALPAREHELLAAARRGDEDAYRRLVEPHRAALHAHCYRMLGSVHDADDAVQEALLRAWRGLRGFEGRSTTRSWLYKVTTNACLTAIERRPKRVLPLDAAPLGDSDGPPPAERVWLEPYPDAAVEAAAAVPHARYDQREGIELAFIAALQHLAATQRAVLILREVLGFSAREVAELLDTTVAAVNSALQRARRAVDERLPERTQQETLRSLGDERLRALVERYVDAWERGDVGAVVSMLADDATFAMPPNAAWFRGRAAIADFLPRGPLSMRRRFVPVGANGQVAFGTYCWEDGRFRANAIHLLTLRGEAIAEITAFLDPGVFAAFGLPRYVAG